MEDFGSTSSQKYREEIKDVNCPLCGKASIRVIFIAGYKSWDVSRISAGSKRTPIYHDPRIIVESKCPNCKSSKTEIKEALEYGASKQLTHEERIKRLKDAGMPTKITSEVKRD